MFLSIVQRQHKTVTLERGKELHEPQDHLGFLPGDTPSHCGARRGNLAGVSFTGLKDRDWCQEAKVAGVCKAK